MKDLLAVDRTCREDGMRCHVRGPTVRPAQVEQTVRTWVSPEGRRDEVEHRARRDWTVGLQAMAARATFATMIRRGESHAAMICPNHAEAGMQWPGLPSHASASASH